MSQVEQNLHNVLFPIYFHGKTEKKNLGIRCQKERNTNVKMYQKKQTNKQTFKIHDLTDFHLGFWWKAVIGRGNDSVWSWDWEERINGGKKSIGMRGLTEFL